MGTVVIAGRTYRVTGLELRGGLLHITARGHGPAAATTDEPVAVFGADGQGVCQGWFISLPELPAGKTMDIILPIRIDTLESQPGETTVIRA